jgi:hypothetical protein
MPDRMIFSHWNGKVSVRTQQYRLDTAGKLYDMLADPGQAKDVTTERPDVAARLSRAVADWRKDLLVDGKKEDRPFTVGYSEFPTTHLPARDGVPHGRVRRSAPAPNCSFFTNWIGLDDFITWDIEVATSGRYEAVVHYTCAAADVGVTIELSCGDGRATCKVTEAHDPPLRGAENDRVPRKGESLVKDFKPLRIGELELRQGRGLLTLRALEVPGKGVIDVRALTLTLMR